ncbi:MAG TPA: DUF4160 domain-containing protein [Longimicrobium sp.]
MPTVLRVGGFAFSFYAGDHDPPHVHVSYSGAAVVLAIETSQVRKIFGMREHDIKRAKALVQAHQEALMASWAAWQIQRSEGGTDGVARPH